MCVARPCVDFSYMPSNCILIGVDTARAYHGPDKSDDSLWRVLQPCASHARRHRSRAA